jgi:hypothetical protein
MGNPRSDQAFQHAQASPSLVSTTAFQLVLAETLTS